MHVYLYKLESLMLYIKPPYITMPSFFLAQIFTFNNHTKLILQQSKVLPYSLPNCLFVFVAENI